ncbi:MAG: hypothetical protein H0Z18_05550 [Thermococcus sp.]|uniref:hypothetical protein n=1 Tax=Thermococcus sp. TaxID=35749 RepID=UPI001DDE7915|nr:hypothetical protein [Thermococcus sp.]MBO8174703.1 hypothetical protein [Thermococcus sp.]
MKYSKLTVELLKGAEQVIYYDPVYHGRTLKIFGIDNDPTKMVKYLADKYIEKEYGQIIFDTTGEYPKDGFETIIKINDGKPTGLDPIRMAKEGIISDPYAAVTIVQTIYELDRSLTEKLYADVLSGKIKSVPQAASSKEKYGEVIRESYTALDEVFFQGDIPEFGNSILVDLSDAHSITIVGMAFLIVAAGVRKRRHVFIGLDDAAVLGYTPAGSAAIPLLTQPMRGRVTVLATRYAIESILNISGPTLVMYTDPDIQSLIYESNGVPPGAMRKRVLKGKGAFIWRTPETINVEEGDLPF